MTKIACALTTAVLTLATMARADLSAYVKKPEDCYAWSLKSQTKQGGCDIFHLRLTSQLWQGIKWEHDLVVFEPKETAPGQPLFLTNTGGSAKESMYPMGVMMANRLKIPCAFLFQIPNQPLFEGKKEDALIAETFVRYLTTGDESWPLLFPMVKSVVRGMDALQAWSKEQRGRTTEKFILTGASKRGWTTWLTASQDPRLMAIAPMVIDVLNSPKQLEHQEKCYGGYSEQISDYTSRGLIPMPDTDRARHLFKMTDAWTYRERYTMPKLVLLGTNDPYWTVDALNIYWDGLPQQKWISYSPNAGHNLSQPAPAGPMRAVSVSAAFVRHLVTGTPMPVLEWKHSDAHGKCVLTVKASPAPESARLWTASSDTLDFRKSKWESSPVSVGKDGLSVEFDPPAAGYAAFFCDLHYHIEDITYDLCTQMRVTEPAGKQTQPPRDK